MTVVIHVMTDEAACVVLKSTGSRAVITIADDSASSSCSSLRIKMTRIMMIKTQEQCRKGAT